MLRGMTPIHVLLAELREKKGWTQQELANRAGVRQATISELESGKKKRLGLDVLDALCKALDVSPGQLLKRSPAPKD